MSPWDHASIMLGAVLAIALAVADAVHNGGTVSGGDYGFIITGLGALGLKGSGVLTTAGASQSVSPPDPPSSTHNLL